jgi:H+/Cl- antiporter ClcA
VGIVSGAFSGFVIIAFRLLAESSFLTFGIRDTAEDFEALTWPWRIGLPVAGGLAIGIMMTSVSAGTRQVGVIHVMERLAYHAGRLPWRNAVLQIAGATIAIVTGHSVGREGPAIHIGAASASLFGQLLHLPNNSIRILVACGTAAAISRVRRGAKPAMFSVFSRARRSTLRYAMAADCGGFERHALG